MSHQFPASESADRALLLATLPSLDTPHFLGPVIQAAAISTRQRLVIVLFSRLFNDPLPSSTTAFHGISHTERWDDVHRLLTYVYVQATKVAQDLDKVLMDVDVLLLGIDGEAPEDIGVGMDIVFRVAGDSIAVPLPASVSSIRQSFLPPGDRDGGHSSEPPSGSPELQHPETPLAPPFFPVVALGGTFDHLHAGHKILLSMAAWITSHKIIVGVTDDVLLVKKSNQHILQRLPVRTQRVRDFLQLFRPGITYDIVPITDVYGPTGWDPNIQALVVSQETINGAEAIAIHREAKSLPPLKTFVIDVISPSSERIHHDDLEILRQTKMSSTFIREWIVEKNKEEEEEDEEEEHGSAAVGVGES